MKRTVLTLKPPYRMVKLLDWAPLGCWDSSLGVGVIRLGQLVVIGHAGGGRVFVLTRFVRTQGHDGWEAWSLAAV